MTTDEASVHGDSEEGAAASEDRVADLTFKARALAQAHPLTVTASTYRAQLIEVERETQPLPEFAEWAATAFLVGYCIRRIEEADVQQMPTELQLGGEADFEALGVKTNEFAMAIRSGECAGEPLLEFGLVEGLLDKVIATEVDKRADHWKSQISKQDWAMFEEYVAWWVVHGYSFRAAETAGINS